MRVQPIIECVDFFLYSSLILIIMNFFFSLIFSSINRLFHILFLIFFNSCYLFSTLFFSSKTINWHGMHPFVVFIVECQTNFLFYTFVCPFFSWTIYLSVDDANKEKKNCRKVRSSNCHISFWPFLPFIQ